MYTSHVYIDGNVTFKSCMSTNKFRVSRKPYLTTLQPKAGKMTGSETVRNKERER